MADASRLKGMVRRQGLGVPPPPEEARTDLALAPAPELSAQPRPAPGADPVTPAAAGRGADPEPAPENARRGMTVEAPRTERIDGRTLRRSGRTVQFATRVTPEFDNRVREIAKRTGLLLVQVLENALDEYEKRLREEAR